MIEKTFYKCEKSEKFKEKYGMICTHNLKYWRLGREQSETTKRGEKVGQGWNYYRYSTRFHSINI